MRTYVQLLDDFYPDWRLEFDSTGEALEYYGEEHLDELDALAGSEEYEELDFND